tara:strand:+ start:155 stop:793 length:639 start_codon:yes stop_codon:yes gene_type:complete
MFNWIKYKEIQGIIDKKGGFTEIIAISKNHPKTSVLEALTKGVLVFGENRVMEAKSKFFDLKKEFPQIKLHLTGPLQSNKVKDAVNLFDVIHTLDREKIAKELHKHKEKMLHKKIFIQVNIGKEETKSGIFPENLKSFVNYCIKDLSLNICGLMCIPPVDDNPSDHFKYLDELNNENNLKELSIGMSNDYKQAIDFKPKYIRLGTILFGQRQ